ncbi:hypothetical protein MC885_004949, partial [Smutsia gigantea]
QKCGLRKAPRKVEPRRSDTEISGEAQKRSALIPPVEESLLSFSLSLKDSPNMYVLWNFSSIVNILSLEQFMAVYLSAGRYGLSLGASGTIMTVLAPVCTKTRGGSLVIFFLPVLMFTAGISLKAMIAVDTAGMILGWKCFNHTAHLCSALFSLCPPRGLCLGDSSAGEPRTLSAQKISCCLRYGNPKPPANPASPPTTAPATVTRRVLSRAGFIFDDNPVP